MAGEPMDPTSFTYHTTHLVQCDGQQYPTGSPFKHSDPRVIAELRKAGAIVLREELERPEAIAARQAELENENATLRAELERLRQGGATAEAASAAKASAALAAEPAASAKEKEAAIKASKAASQPAAAAASASAVGE